MTESVDASGRPPNTPWWQRTSIRFGVLAGLACGAAAVCLARPSLVAARFVPDAALPPDDFAAAALAVTRVLGWLAAVLTAAFAIRAVLGLPRRLRSVWTCVVLGAVYLALTSLFSSWLIDDAAITFAYSENLVRGYGLVLHPSLPPEEGYSTTLWMLMLAAVRALGVELPVAAKVANVVVGLAIVALSVRTAEAALERSLSGLGTSLLAAVLFTAPFLIWSVSGLEHGLQALIFLWIVHGIQTSRRHLWISAIAGSALVLVRPEAPLVLVGLGVAYVIDTWRKQPGIRPLLELWPLPLLPALTLAGLLAFRMSYFGDPLPNPYYAKASDASFLRILNVFGGGWRYVLTWLETGAIFAVLPLLALLALRPLPPSMAAAIGLALGQLAFVLYAGGDWMGHWRFLAALAPLLALLVVFGFERSRSGASGRAVRAMAWIAIAAVSLATIRHLVEFRAAPTTPYEVVAQVGETFVELAARLGIEDPLLLHHDAGGTSYRARIRILDMTGLGDRAIAKHMHDPDFLRHYVLVEKKPDFVFGGVMFATLNSQLHETEEFERDYVELSFGDDHLMAGGLCHVRRDRVREAPGIELVYADDGRLAKVVVQR